MCTGSGPPFHEDVRVLDLGTRASFLSLESFLLSLLIRANLGKFHLELVWRAFMEVAKFSLFALGRMH